MTGKRYSTEEMLARLIAFDTTSRDGNLPLIEFVESYMYANCESEIDSTQIGELVIERQCHLVAAVLEVGVLRLHPVLFKAAVEDQRAATLPSCPRTGSSTG